MRGFKTASPATPRSAASGGGDAAPTFEDEALAAVDSLYRTALRLTGVPSDAEDLVQDTYLKAFRAAHTFEPGTNVRAWLFTILHNTAKNRTRDRARAATSVDTEAVERALDLPGGPGPVAGRAEIETPETLLLRDTLGPELQAAIDALPEQFREAVWLRDVEEFPTPKSRACSRFARHCDVADLARPAHAV